MANLLATLLGFFGGTRARGEPALVSGGNADAQPTPAADTPLDDGPRVPGWFGKLPAVGDFASRRLPDDFVARWDTWLAEGMQAGAETLGAAWGDTFAKAPVWRFLLAPGVADGNAWIGVIAPSADKVGRIFPLTIVLRLRARAVPPAALTAWLDAATLAALACREAEATIDRLDEQLTALGEPAFVAAAPDASGDDGVLAHWPVATAFEPAFGAAAPWLVSELRAVTFWWPGGEGDRAITVVRGLPSAASFAKMIGGAI